MSTSAIALLAAGGFLLLAALLWRLGSQRRIRHQLLTALADDDELKRATAVEVAGSGGIARYADVFLGLVRDDPSPVVRERVVEVVARNQWEPPSTRAIVDLRLEVEQLLYGARVRDAAGRRASDAKTTAPRAPTVLVTGAGGPAGVAVIRALKRAGHRVAAVDVDPMAAGLPLADHAGIVPRADDEHYAEAIITAARASRATAVVPTIAEELIALAGATADLDAAGIAHFFPDRAAVARCIDKWEFANTLRSAGIPAPATALGTAEDVPGPWVVKPRFGRGSRDVYVVEDREALQVILDRVDDPIVQTKLPGREFTIDALVGRDGDLVGAVPRWRLETRGGISTKGETFADLQLVEDVGKLLRVVGLAGPANIQGFADEDGRWAFVEVNPRFSGGLPLSLAAGADLVGEYLRAVLGESPRPERLAFRAGVRMTRYFDEVFEG